VRRAACGAIANQINHELRAIARGSFPGFGPKEIDMDTPIRDRDGRAVGEAQAVKHHDRQLMTFSTSGADRVPAGQQARLHCAMASKGTGAAGLVVAGGAL